MSENAPLKIDATDSIKTLTPDIVRLKAKVEGLQIIDDDVMAKSADLMKIIKTSEKAIDAEEKKYTKPLVDVTKSIRDNFRPIKTSLTAVITALKLKQTNYLKEKQERERKKAAEEQAAFEAQALEQAETLNDLGLSEAAEQVVETASKFQVKAAPTKAQGQTATTSIVRSLNFELEDISKVPAAYLLINSSKVKEEIVALRDSLEKEGLEKGLTKAKAKEYVYDNILKAEFISGVKIVINENVSTR